MEDNYPQSLDARRSEPQPRKYVYRSVEPDDMDCAHPLRRCTDTPREFRGVAGEICPKPMMLKMRVYLKLN
jgi:hypothetical protein